MAQTPKTSQGGASLSSKVWLPSMKTVQPIWSQPPGPMRGDCQTTHVCHHPHNTMSMSLQQEVEWEVQSGMCWWSTSTFENSCGCTALDMLEWREVTEQIDLQAKHPLQVDCFSEDLKCWEAWDTTCGHKAKDVTPLIAWRRDALKEEVLGSLPWKDQRGPGHHQIRWTLELFQRQCWGNFWEMGLSAYGLFWAHRYHFELNWTVEAKMLSVKITCHPGLSVETDFQSKDQYWNIILSVKRLSVKLDCQSKCCLLYIRLSVQASVRIDCHLSVKTQRPVALYWNRLSIKRHLLKQTVSQNTSVKIDC